MIGSRFGRGLGPGLVVLILSAGPVQAGWQEDLAWEIEQEHDCKLSFLSHVVERQIEGRSLVLAKAHCADGRAFDAERSGDDQLFSFKECTNEETAAC